MVPTVHVQFFYWEAFQLLLCSAVKLAVYQVTDKISRNMNHCITEKLTEVQGFSCFVHARYRVKVAIIFLYAGCLDGGR